MKKVLPALLTLVFAVVSLATPIVAFAQTPGLQLGTISPTVSATQSAIPNQEGIWVLDPEVTFIGKNAARAGLFLDWTLQNYTWSCVKQIIPRSSAKETIYCDNSNNPIAKYWSLIVLNIVVPLLFVVILATSAVIIITRGKSLTIMRFIPRFVAVVLLIAFSYSLLQFFYQFFDLIQGFFLRSDPAKPCPPDCISQRDLLYVGWNYTTFVGLRKLGDLYAESAFMSLLLTKLTALTYFVMTFLLLVRKIILWFFIIVSPVFPILLLFYPVRNTAKIWIGEFFRWLLYAPLFAIFLNGLVYLWRNQIPLVFTNAAINNPSLIVFPTAVNILLGGPRQFVTPTNSINLIETFALYVVSLIMLWIVILLPWILLQIFLDYASNFAPGDTAVMKTLVNMATTNRQPPGGSGPQPPSEGAAISLPFSKKFSIPKDLQPRPTGEAKEINAQGATIKASFAQPLSIPNASVNAQVVAVANVKIPTLRDIAKFDSALVSRDISKQREVAQLNQSLVNTTVDREVHDTIVEKSQQGNIVASSILKAANLAAQRNSRVETKDVKKSLQQIADPSLAGVSNRQKMSKLNEMLKKESSENKSELASKILSVTDKTADRDVEKIKEQLSQTSGTHLSKSVNAAVSQSAQQSTQIKGVIQQVANPAGAPSTTNKQQVVKLRGTLEQASKKGNQLATSILAVDEKTSVDEIEALQQKIQEAKDKGEPIAAEVAALAESTTTLPSVNRVQTVSKEDFQAVRDMWKQNYQNLEVPQGMAGTRTDWIKDDIASIEETIGLLSSPDQDKQQEGMDQVSNLLPFLMMGGFSQNEIVGYLQAKKDAAKDVSQVLAKEEDDKVSVSTQTKAVEGHLAATLEDDEPKETKAPIEAADQKPETEKTEPVDPLDKVEAGK